MPTLSLLRAASAAVPAAALAAAVAWSHAGHAAPAHPSTHTAGAPARAHLAPAYDPDASAPLPGIDVLLRDSLQLVRGKREMPRQDSVDTRATASSFGICSPVVTQYRAVT